MFFFRKSHFCFQILDGSRRRTPGGVFIFLFKSDPEIDTQIKDLIGEENRKKLRALAKANKKKNARPKTFAESLEQVRIDEIVRFALKNSIGSSFFSCKNNNEILF